MNMPPEQESRQRTADTGNLALAALAIRNGKFSPARNENGRAIESDVTLPVVHWQLKEE